MKRELKGERCSPQHLELARKGLGSDSLSVAWVEEGKLVMSDMKMMRKLAR